MLWSLAIFWARDRPEPDVLGFEAEERFKKSVARKDPLPSERLPFAYDLGQRLGTAERIAFKDMYSPAFPFVLDWHVLIMEP